MFVIHAQLLPLPKRRAQIPQPLGWGEAAAYLEQIVPSGLDSSSSVKDLTICGMWAMWRNAIRRQREDKDSNENTYLPTGIYLLEVLRNARRIYLQRVWSISLRLYVG